MSCRACYLLLLPASAFAFQLAPIVHRFTMLQGWILDHTILFCGKKQGFP